jgi:hypothetical protein
MQTGFRLGVLTDKRTGIAVNTNSLNDWILPENLRFAHSIRLSAGVLECQGLSKKLSLDENSVWQECCRNLVLVAKDSYLFDPNTDKEIQSAQERLLEWCAFMNIKPPTYFDEMLHDKEAFLFMWHYLRDLSLELAENSSTQSLGHEYLSKRLKTIEENIESTRVSPDFHLQRMKYRTLSFALSICWCMKCIYASDILNTPISTRVPMSPLTCISGYYTLKLDAKQLRQRLGGWILLHNIDHIAQSDEVCLHPIEKPRKLYGVRDLGKITVDGLEFSNRDKWIAYCAWCIPERLRNMIDSCLDWLLGSKDKAL